ncbi:histamine N-methyltransferase-like isoform X2 [Ptychodera flava]|uniref:histamine N-methyltransferase-like isoform X2 n=1 Tax=Ptychodera flava TaxID=63121 RepID=UPI00396A0330
MKFKSTKLEVLLLSLQWYWYRCKNGLKMTQELKALIHFPKEYFEGLSTLYRNGLANFAPTREQDLKHACDRFAFSRDREDMLRVLVIGPADVIDYLVNKFGKISYVVVEPAKDEIQKFEDLVKSKQEQSLWTTVNFEFYPCTIEAYLTEIERGATHGSFDIILLQHSAYHIMDPANVFAELYGQLNGGGMLYCQIDTGPMEEVRLRVGSVVSDSIPRFGSTALRKMLQRCMPHVKIHTQYRKMNFKAGECFKEESRDGNLIVDFLVQLHDFRKTAPREVVDDIMKFIRDSCYELDNNMYFPADDEDIIMIKE